METKQSGMSIIYDALQNPHKEIPDDGYDTSRDNEEQNRGLTFEQVKGCGLLLGETYTITSFNTATNVNETFTIKVTGIFIDGYAFVRV